MWWYHRLFIAEVLAVRMPGDHFQHCVHAPLLLNYAHQISQADSVHANLQQTRNPSWMNQHSQTVLEQLMGQ